MFSRGNSREISMQKSFIPASFIFSMSLSVRGRVSEKEETRMLFFLLEGSAKTMLGLNFSVQLRGNPVQKIQCYCNRKLLHSPLRIQVHSCLNRMKKLFLQFLAKAIESIPIPQHKSIATLHFSLSARYSAIDSGVDCSKESLEEKHIAFDLENFFLAIKRRLFNWESFSIKSQILGLKMNKMVC